MVLKLSEDVINQIKDFPEPDNYYGVKFPFYDNLSKEQKSLIDELIPNEKLRERCKKLGLCKECSQPNTGRYFHIPWCQSCNSDHFQQDFNKWTGGNKEIDEFIQKFQLNAACSNEVLEWIPYEKFDNVEYLARGGFGTVHKARWIDGNISRWDINQNKWKRFSALNVALKCLNGSQGGITTDILQEVYHFIFL